MQNSAVSGSHGMGVSVGEDVAVAGMSVAGEATVAVNVSV
jgi:hypothetical protein